MLARMKKMFKKEKGFTLVELLAVIAILAIIVAIAVPTIGNVIEDSRAEAAEANKELIENAAKLADVSGYAPTDNEYSITNLETEGFLDLPEDADKSGKVTVEEKGNGGKIYTYVPAGSE